MTPLEFDQPIDEVPQRPQLVAELVAERKVERLGSEPAKRFRNELHRILTPR